MSKKQTILIALAGFVVGAIVAAVVASIIVQRMPAGLSTVAATQSASSASAPQNCAVTDSTATISGDSMQGILSSGQQVTVLNNYYACHDVTRGDIVAYDYPGTPIVKKVMGVPGDTFGVQASGSGWNIMINGQQQKNAQGVTYVIPNDAMLALYVTSYHGVIPPETYLILGNDPAGSNDSTKFGLVAKSGFLGKVQI